MPEDLKEGGTRHTQDMIGTVGWELECIGRLR